MADNRPHRRLPALKVRTMLVCVLAVGVWLGLWVHTSRNQELAVATVTSAPYFANVTYDDEFFAAPSGIPGGIGGMGLVRRRKSWVPESVEARLGKDYFHNVLAIAFSKDDASSSPGDRNIFRTIAGVPSLEQLSPNVEVTDADVRQIAELPSLRILSLPEVSPGLSDEAMRMLSAMPLLEMLEIHNAPITDAGVAHLKGTPNLRSLLLSNAQPFSTDGNRIAVRGEGFAHLVGLPDLTDLEIHSAALTGEGLKHIGSLKHLTRLRLKCARITDDDLRSLASLTELESLEIVGAGIDGTGFRHLAGLSKVTSVCLEGRNITDAAVPYLARLPALESVMIYGTRVTASGLEKFRAAPRLVQMGLNPSVTGDTKRLKLALPKCNVLNGGASL